MSENSLNDFYRVVHKNYLKARDFARNSEEFPIMCDPDDSVETTSNVDDRIARELEWLERFTQQPNYKKKVPEEWQSSLQNLFDIASNENLKSIPKIEELPSIESNPRKDSDYYEMKFRKEARIHDMLEQRRIERQQKWRRRMSFFQTLCCVSKKSIRKTR